MGVNPDAVSKADARPNHGVWTDLDVCTKRSSVLHDRTGMDLLHQALPLGGTEIELKVWSVSIALYSASAQSSSPTKARPSNRQTGPRWRRTRTGMRNVTPG